jgi:hypothetical protein
MAGQRGRRKAVAARQKARNEGHRDKKQESGHIPRKHDANLKTNAQGEGGIKKKHSPQGVLLMLQSSSFRARS